MAKGFPTPFISWRQNWGHTCEEKETERCSSFNWNGRGLLRIKEAKFSDEGTYACEAMNTMGKAFSYVETIVKIRKCNTTAQPKTTTKTVPSTAAPKTLPPTLAPKNTPPTTKNIKIKEIPTNRTQAECKCNNHANECSCNGKCLVI